MAATLHFILGVFSILNLNCLGDQFPLFVEIIEESPIGTYIHDVSEHLETLRLTLAKSDTSLVQYQLLGNDPTSRLFSLHPTLGHLRIAARIDRETLCPAPKTKEKHSLLGKYPFLASTQDRCIQSLNILMISGAGPGHTNLSNSISATSRVLIYLIIRDVNDNAPRWSVQGSELQVSFVETPTQYSTFGSLVQQSAAISADTASKFAKSIERALDPDLGLNGTVSYKLIGPGAELFYLNDGLTKSENSEVMLDQQTETPLRIWPLVPLDRETEEFAGNGGVYNLTIIATDLGIPPKTGSSVLLINVVDVNDNPPVFFSDHFAMNSVDGSRRNKELVIYRPPGGKLSETLPVGSLILQLNASDQDTGLHAKLTYEFCPCDINVAWDYFKIEQDTGYLSILKRLDYDEGPRHFIFKVIAKDSAPEPYTLTGTAVVEIELSDENDEYPEINVMLVDSENVNDKELTTVEDMNTNALTTGNNGKLLRQYTTTILENPMPETVVAYIQVTDKDNHGQDQVNCQLGPRDNFTLRPDSFENKPLTLSNAQISLLPNRLDYLLIARAPGHMGSLDEIMDREHTPKQLVTLSCTDSGGNTAYVIIHIILMDVNDNRPRFTAGNLYVFPVLENQELIAGKPSWLGRISAFDLDEGINSKIEYKLDYNSQWYQTVNMDQMFELDKETGDFFTKVSFDRENSPADGIYRLSVLAMDKGIPSLTGTTNIEICIIDINDWAPQFTKDVYTFHVQEDTRVQEIIGHVEAIDRDSDSQGKITYRLSESAETHDYFKFREKRSNSTDGAMKTDDLSTYAKEQTSNELLKYASSIKSSYSKQPSEFSYFSVDQLSGKLRLRRRLDRETMAYFSLEIIASDVAPFSKLPARFHNYPAGTFNHTYPAHVTEMSLSSTATMVIVVTDTNDNAPVFRRPNSSVIVQLRLHETLGRQLMVVEASDSDEGDNARISYAIRTEVPRPSGGPGTGYFSIDETSGILFLAKTLNTTLSHRLVIEACDNAVNGKKLCTLSPAIRISIYDETQLVESGGYAHQPAQSGQSDSLPLDFDTLAARSAISVQASRRNEVVVVCLVVIFSLLLLATLFLVACLIHRRGTVRWFVTPASNKPKNDMKGNKQNLQVGQQNNEPWFDEAVVQEHTNPMLDSKFEMSNASSYAQIHGNQTDRYLVHDNNGMIYATPQPVNYLNHTNKIPEMVRNTTGANFLTQLSPARVFAYRDSRMNEHQASNIDSAKIQRRTEAGFCDFLTQSAYKNATSDYQSLDALWAHEPRGIGFTPANMQVCQDRTNLLRRINPKYPKEDSAVHLDTSDAQGYYEVTDGEEAPPRQPDEFSHSKRAIKRATTTLGRSSTTKGKIRLMKKENSMHDIKAGDLAIPKNPDDNNITTTDCEGNTSSGDQKANYTYHAYREGTFV